MKGPDEAFDVGNVRMSVAFLFEQGKTHHRENSRVKELNKYVRCPAFLECDVSVASKYW